MRKNKYIPKFQMLKAGMYFEDVYEAVKVDTLVYDSHKKELAVAFTVIDVPTQAQRKEVESIFLTEKVEPKVAKEAPKEVVVGNIPVEEKKVPKKKKNSEVKTSE